MKGSTTAFPIIAAAILSAGTPAIARDALTRTCQVVHSGKQAASMAVADNHVCRIFDQEIREAFPAQNYRIDIHVISAGHLSATVNVGKNRLSEQHFAVMDRNLTSDDFRRFARSIAAAARAERR